MIRSRTVPFTAPIGALVVLGIAGDGVQRNRKVDRETSAILRLIFRF